MTPSNLARLASSLRVQRVNTTRGADTTAYTAGDVVGRKPRKALTSISNADPAVCTLVAHGYEDGDEIQLTTSGVLPAGLALLTSYFVVNAAANTFELSAEVDGDSIVTTDAGSGTHTAYPVGAAILAFTNIGEQSPAFQILHSTLAFDLAAVPASMSTFRLHLFASSPASALADNDVWAMTAADFVNYVGFIDLGTPVDLGAFLAIQVKDVNRPVSTKLGTLYGYLVTDGGYTPAASTTATIDLAIA